MNPRLPAEVIERSPPLGLGTDDQPLFQHEYRRTLGEVCPLNLDVDFLPQGLLVFPRSATLAPEGFQAGVPSGREGLKARVRAWEARLLFPRTQGRREAARTPLIATDEFSNGFFHWVGDVLPKMAWLADDLERFELILPAFAHRFRYMEESLALWPQLRWRVVEPRTRVFLKDAVVIPALAPTGNYRPSLMKALGVSWRHRVNPASPWRRVYVSRAKAPWRKIRNEAEVWSALAPLGFERVFLEDLSFADQVKLAAETLVLVSNHGAGLTDMAFMVPGTRVLEIRLTGDAVNNCYYALASALGLEYTYLLAAPAPGGNDAHTSDLMVDVVALLKTLEVGP